MYHSYILELSNYYNPLSVLRGSANVSLPSLDSVFSPVHYSSPKSLNRESNRETSHSHPIRHMSRVSSHHQSTKSNTDSDAGGLIPSKQNNRQTLIINANGISGKRAELATLVDYTDPDSILGYVQMSLTLANVLPNVS